MLQLTQTRDAAFLYDASSWANRIIACAVPDRTESDGVFTAVVRDLCVHPDHQVMTKASSYASTCSCAVLCCAVLLPTSASPLSAAVVGRDPALMLPDSLFIRGSKGCKARDAAP